MTTYGVTASGFVRKPLSVIIAELEANWITIFGPDVDMSASTPDGQWIGVRAAMQDELWQLAEADYQSMRPQQAIGAGLSDIVVFNDMTRNAGSFSLVTVGLVSTQDITLSDAFRLQSSAGDLWKPLAPGLYANGSFPVFQAVESGPVSVPIGDSWTVVTPLSGITSFANAAVNYVTGTATETDGELRARQRVSTENQAVNILEALNAALLDIDGVTRARVYVNDTAGVVAGRPSKSYEVVVEGGTDLEIADAIWANHPSGIEIFGMTSQVIVDSQGFNQTMKFTRPTPVPIIVDIDLSVGTDYPGTGDDEMKQAIVDYSNKAGAFADLPGFGIGDDVNISKLYTPINSIPGQFVIALQIGDPILGTIDIPVSELEYPVFTIGNITVSS